MNRLTFRDRWNRFWFEPAQPQTLGFARLILMVGAFLYYHGRNYESWGYVRPSFWQSTWLFLHLHWHPVSPMAMGWLGFAWKAALLLAGIGLFTRFSCAIAFALGLYLIGLPNNIGKVDHNDAIVLWSFLIMAVARSGDAWSIDALIRTARKKPPTPVSERTREDPGFVSANTRVFGVPQTPASVSYSEIHPEYRWPLRMMQVLMALVFCISGCAKLRTSGVAWAFSDNLRNTFIMQQYLGDPPTNWALWFASQGWLCYTLAAATLLFETTAPLALFSRVARCIIIPSLFFMQVGNELVLGINFRQFMLCYAFWLPWSDIGRALRHSMQASKPPRKIAVLFDGSCGLCQRTIELIRRLDLLQKVEILDAMNDWTTIAARYPSLDQDEALRIMHAVDADGRVTTGFYAYRTLCKVIPLSWPMLPLLYIPGVPTIGSIVYERVANGRFRTGCAIDVRPPLVPSPGTPGEG